MREATFYVSFLVNVEAVLTLFIFSISSSPYAGLIIHVSAENCKFLQLADELELMKPTRNGVMKNFNISCLDDFYIDDSMSIDNVLTLGDRQMLIKHAIDNIKATEFEKFIPGYEHSLLYHGESLIAACLNEGLIENIYSLRDTVEYTQFPFNIFDT